MKPVLAALAVLLVLALLGWYTLFAEDDRAGIDVNPDVVAEDLEAADDALESGAEKVKEEVGRVDIDVDVSRD